MAVVLSGGIRDAAARFDRAMAAGNYTEAKAAGDRIQTLCGQLCETDPVTPQGAAARLALAIDLLDWANAGGIGQIQIRLAQIENRLRRGRRCAKDRAYLGALLEEWNDGTLPGIAPDAIRHIRAAFGGLQKPRAAWFTFKFAR